MKNFNGTLDSDGKTYKHVFFDMDNTLTHSRTPIEDDMKEALGQLLGPVDVVVVSGGEETRMWKQMTDYFRGKISFLVQNGNNGYSHKKGKYLWERRLPSEEKNEILKHIASIEKKYGDLIERFRKEDRNKLTEDRGCQISFSFVGHNALLADKRRFDPDGSVRLGILKALPLNSRQVDAKLGGTTCFDYNQLGKNKGYNIGEWMKYFGWRSEDVLYVGDALFPGGNDDSVFGCCDTLQVSGPAETLAVIRKIVCE